MSWIIFLITFACTFAHVESVVPSNVPFSGYGLTRNELIMIYVMEGLKYVEIFMFLFCKHNIKISVRHLKRIV